MNPGIPAMPTRDPAPTVGGAVAPSRRRCRFLPVILCIPGLLLASLLTARAGAAGDALVRRGGHPYLFFTADNVARLKERVQKEPALAEAWAGVLASANRAVEPPAPGGRAGPPGGGMEQLCLAYRMTGEQKFAEKIRELLLRQCERPMWNESEMLRRDPPWHSALGTAATCYTVALGYDCIHDDLSPADRDTIAKGLVELGILPTLNDWVLGDKRIHALDTMGHNWWSACVFMAGVGALAVLDEEPRAPGWLEEISRGSVEWFNYAGSALGNKPRSFDPGGALYESINYDNFAVSEYLLFRLAWTNAFRAPAPPEIPVLDKVGDFFINVCYPNSGPLMSLNFGDGSLTVDGSRPVALLWALGYHQPRYLWYLGLTRQTQFHEGLSSASPLGLVYYPSAADLAAMPSAPDLPVSALFRDMGWATLRSSWDKDATLLAVRSGFTWNHAHADAGSFILFHRGAYLLIDSGNCNYALPEYDGYYRQSRAHNVVLFNGEAENPEDTYFGSQFPGTVSHLLDAGNLKYVLADATGPTAHLFVRNFRHFLWLGDVILIIDDVKSYQSGQFAWLLHFDGQAERRGLDLHVTQGGASVLVRPLFPETFPDAGLPTDYPERMRLVPQTGLKDHDAGAKVTYYAFEPPELTRQTSFITAVVLVNDANQDHLPQLERLEGTNMIGVRLHQNGTTTDVYLNLLANGRIRHRNANIVADGWETDAYLTAITGPDGANPADPDAATRFFVADGSYLRRDGKVVLDSLSKVFLVAERKGTALNVQLQGQPVINARLRAAQKPSAIELNGRPAEAAYDDQAKTLMFSLRGGAPDGAATTQP
jgi:hypothetical protein